MKKLSAPPAEKNKKRAKVTLSAKLVLEVTGSFPVSTADEVKMALRQHALNLVTKALEGIGGDPVEARIDVFEYLGNAEKPDG
jgi:hypothetical protein